MFDVYLPIHLTNDQQVKCSKSFDLGLLNVRVRNQRRVGQSQLASPGEVYRWVVPFVRLIKIRQAQMLRSNGKDQVKNRQPFLWRLGLGFGV